MDALEVVNAVLQNILKGKGCVCGPCRLALWAKALACKPEYHWGKRAQVADKLNINPAG